MSAPTLMPDRTAPVSATPDPFAAACDRARTGAMPLAEVMDLAGRWQGQGQIEAAIALYDAWLAGPPAPMRHVALFNHGTLLGAQRRHEAAEAAYRQAIALQPGFVQAHLNLGHQLEHLGRPDEALAGWERVLDLVAVEAAHRDPTLRELRLHAQNNLARLLEQRRRYPEAQAHMEASLALKPGQWDVIQHLVHLRQKQCAWPIYQDAPACPANQQLVGTSALAMLSISDDPALQLMAAQRWVHERGPKLAPDHRPLHEGRAPRTGRIRIGYLSGDLKMHAVGLLTAELYELHDRERFEVHAFCWSREDGTPLRKRILDAMDHVTRIDQVDDETAARLIADAGIDVLVDLQGLTNGARPGILARRPAPVQVSYLGFPGTCALPGVDWIVADDVVLPREAELFHTERPMRVPTCYQVSDRQRPEGRVPTRAEAGLPEQGFVFCSFNNTFKFTPELFDCWMRVLGQVSGSVLWLLADNDTARANLTARAEAAGIDPARLVFAGRVAPPDYLSRFRLADLVLDTFPYNAGTTASDCLWMGVPILTLAGRSYISRMAASLLTAAGLPDLVTTTLADYERLAVTLGRTPARAASYKRYLTETVRQSPLFDVPRLVRELEAAFEREALAACATPR